MNRKRGDGKWKKIETPTRSNLNCLLCNTFIITPNRLHTTPVLYHHRTHGRNDHSLYSVKSFFSIIFKLPCGERALESLDSSETNFCELCVNKFLTLIHTQQKMESLLVTSIQSYATVISDTLLSILAQSAQENGKHHHPDSTTHEFSLSNPELEVTRMAVKLFLGSTLYPGDEPKEFALIGSENLKGQELSHLREFMTIQMEEIKLLLGRSNDDAGNPKISEKRRILLNLILGIDDEVKTSECQHEESVDKLQQEAIVRLEECQLDRDEDGPNDDLVPQDESCADDTTNATSAPKRSKRILATPQKKLIEHQNDPTSSSSRPKRKVTIAKRYISPSTENSKKMEGVVLLKPGFLQQILGQGHLRDSESPNETELSPPNLTHHVPRGKGPTVGPRRSRHKKAEGGTRKATKSNSPPRLSPQSTIEVESEKHVRQKKVAEDEQTVKNIEPVLPNIPVHFSGDEIEPQPTAPAVANSKPMEVNRSSKKGRVKKTRRGIRIKRKKPKKPNPPQRLIQDQEDSEETVVQNADGESKSISGQIGVPGNPSSEADLDQSLITLAKEISQNLSKEKDVSAVIESHCPPSVQVKYEVITLRDSDSECSIKSEHKKHKIELNQRKEDIQIKSTSPKNQFLAEAKRKKLWTQKYFKYITNIKKRREKSTRIFKCKTCDKFYKSETRLQSHQLIHAPGYYAYVCTEAGCLKKFTEERPFLRHKQCHMLSAQKKLKLAKSASRKKLREASVLMYPCMFCNFSTKSRSRAEKHMEVSHNERYKRNIHLVRARADELELKHHERLLAMESEPTEGPMENEMAAQKLYSPAEPPKELQSASSTKTTYGELFPSSQYINCPTCYKLFANLEQYVNHFCDYRKAPLVQSSAPAYNSGAPKQWPSSVVSAQGYQISWVPLSQAPAHQTPSAYYTPYVPPTYNWNQYEVNQFQNYPKTQNTNSNGNGYENMSQGVYSSQYVLPTPPVAVPVPVVNSNTSSDTGPLPPRQAEFTLQDLLQFEETLDELTTL